MGTADTNGWQTAATFNDTIRDLTGAGLQYWVAAVMVLALVVSL